MIDQQPVTRQKHCSKILLSISTFCAALMFLELSAVVAQDSSTFELIPQDRELSGSAIENLPIGQSTVWLTPPSLGGSRGPFRDRDLWRIDPNAIDQAMVRGEAAYVDLEFVPSDIIVGDPSVAQATITASNPERLIITATGLGITNFLVFAPDGSQQLALRVRVLREYIGARAQDMLGPFDEGTLAAEEAGPRTVVVCRPQAPAFDRRFGPTSIITMVDIETSIECQERELRF